MENCSVFILTWRRQNYTAKVIVDMSVKLSDVQTGSSCSVSEIKGDLRVRQHLAKLGVLLGVEVIVEREAKFWKKQLSL